MIKVEREIKHLFGISQFRELGGIWQTVCDSSNQYDIVYRTIQSDNDHSDGKVGQKF